MSPRYIWPFNRPSSDPGGVVVDAVFDEVVPASEEVVVEVVVVVEPSPAPGTAAPVDLSAPSGPATLIDAAIEHHGALDLLVNNVGAVRPRTDRFLALADEDRIWAMNIDLMAAVRAMRAALPTSSSDPEPASSARGHHQQ